MKKGRIGLLAGVCVAALSAVLPVSAFAQDAPPPDAANEIVVTAQRREEALQDVPISVSAFGNDELQQLQVQEVNDLQFNVPNFTYTDNSYGGSNIAIRGIGRTALNSSADSGVALHVNGGYVEGAINDAYFDIERIEILRGPQGTLYGRNTTAGALNLITAKPTDLFEGRLEAEIGSYNARRLEGVINLPVGERLAFRLAGRSDRRDGFIENVTTGNDIDGADEYALRLSARWTPTETTDVNLVASYSREDSSAAQEHKIFCKRDPTGVLGCLPDAIGTDAPNGLATLGGIFAQAPALFGFPELNLVPVGADIYAGALNPTDRRKVAADFDPTSVGHNARFTLNIEQDIGALRLSSTTLFSEGEGQAINDPDLIRSVVVFDNGLTAPLSAVETGDRLLGSLGGSVLGDFNRSVTRQLVTGETRQVSQEVRLSSDFGGRYDFQIGAFYTDVQRNSDLIIQFSPLEYFAAFAGVYPPFFRLQTLENSLQSVAAFGELYVRPTEDLKLTFGLRRSEDEKRVRDRNLFLETPLGAEPKAFRDQKATFGSTTGRIVLDWTPRLAWTDDTLVYASYSRGARSGGLNPDFDPTQFPGQSASFDGESIDAYEIGAKNTLLNGRVTANLALFYYDFQGLQLSRATNRSEFIENVDAVMKGAEFELAAEVFDGLTFDVSLSLLDATLGQAFFADPRDPAANNATVNGVRYNNAKDLSNGANCAVPASLLDAIAADPTNPFPRGFIPSCFELAPLGALLDGVPVSLKGNSLPDSPEMTFSAGVQYIRTLPGDFTITARLDYYRRGDFFTRVYNRGADRIEGYENVNAFIQIDAPKERWFLRGAVKNLTDEAAITQVAPTDQSFGLFSAGFLGDPRQYTLTVGARF